ncbi:DUF2971 family protein [Chitinophaga polysaccharea]|uniref:DUF2971 family protein n=1 Tax=Chitinophaga polysaccharea TaxID=1293035 RepID=A0A561P6S9_9BACT|nr:DUF2971 domain-containing protein [Chitinophaga polysaccharea]TWF33815.1 DUF2971 family protein [Chitinophaga polysaccharea]
MHPLHPKLANRINFNEDKDKIDFDTPISRVYPLNRLLELIFSKRNTLVKPQMWDDPFENCILQQTVKTKAGREVSFGTIQQSLYGQCWTLNLEESDALWRIYSHAKNGVRVKTTLNKLWDGFCNEKDKNVITSYFIGKIIYKEANEIQDYFENPGNLTNILTSSAKGIATTVLVKRKEFTHEKEIRLVYIADKNNYDITQGTYQYEVNPTDLFDELLFDPRFDDKIFEVIKAELIACGFTKPIQKSILYQAPEFNMTINW